MASIVVLRTLKLYPSQTKNLEEGTKDDMRIFEALLKDVSTQFGPRTIEKCFENPHYTFCSLFQNLRLGGINYQIIAFVMIDLSYLLFSYVFYRGVKVRLFTRHTARTVTRAMSDLRKSFWRFSAQIDNTRT